MTAWDVWTWTALLGVVFARTEGEAWTAARGRWPGAPLTKMVKRRAYRLVEECKTPVPGSPPTRKRRRGKGTH